MKSFMTALSIALLLILGGIGYNIFVAEISDELERDSDEMAVLVAGRDFGSAREKLAGILVYFDGKKPLLASILSHESIDDIELCMAELEGSVENELFDEAIVGAKRLKRLFRALPANYSLVLQNIL